MSEIKKHINTLIGYSFKPLFKKEGFKKVGLDFIKEGGGNIKIVNFWPGYSDFTISLGIYFHKINEGMIARLQRNNPIKVASCHVQQQHIETIADNKNIGGWPLYHLGELVDLERLSKEVYDVFVRFGLPWLNECNDYEQALQYLSDGRAYSFPMPFVESALYLALGNVTEAKKILIDSYDDYIERHSNEDMKDSRGCLVYITKDYNEFSEKNKLGLSFVNKFN